MKRKLLSFLTSTIIVLLLGISGKVQAQTDLEIVKMRFFDTFIASPDVTSNDEQITNYLASMELDGHWDDIDYASRAQSIWPPSNHLARLQTFVRGYSNSASSYYDSPALLLRIEDGLEYWLNLNPAPSSTNWWFGTIAVPKLVGNILLGLQVAPRGISSTMESDMLVWMTKGNKLSQYIAEGGANLTDIALHYMVRACLTGDENLLSETTEIVFNSIKVDPSDGIQIDNSFKAHGPQLYTYGYGSEFIKGISVIAPNVAGTSFAMPADKMAILSSFIRKGFMKPVRGSSVDFNMIGRGISRPRIVRAMPELIEPIAKIDLPQYANEYADAIARMSGEKDASYNVKPEHYNYWKTDYSLHIRPKYTFGLRTVSTRTAKSETGNGENLKGHFLTEGVTYIGVKGDEYYNNYYISPTWDWNKIPGTTTPEITTYPDRPIWGYNRGKSSFVGGVTDGVYAVNAYSFNDYSTKAKKAWFFFDDEVVCLGSAISATADEAINTTVNQCLLTSAVNVSTTGGTVETLATGMRTFSGDLQWATQGDVGYYFPNGGDLSLSNQTQTGTWSSINGGLNRPDSLNTVSNEVFKMWFTHGVKPNDASYAYYVLPGKGSTAAMQGYDASAIKILENSENIQAVLHKGLNLLQVVFYRPDTLAYDGISLVADKACTVMLKNPEAAEVTASVADPTQSLSQLSLFFKNDMLIEHRVLNMDLPAGDYAGSSTSGIFNGETAVYIAPKTTSSVDSLVAVADAFVDTRNPTTNYGTAGYMAAQNDAKDSYLRFDISTLDLDKISSAEMVLFSLTDGTPSGKDLTFTLHSVDNQWDENTITWSMVPAAGDFVATAKGVGASQQLKIDITNTLKGLPSGTKLVSFRLSSNGQYAGFSTIDRIKDNKPSTSEFPMIVVKQETSSTTITTNASVVAEADAFVDNGSNNNYGASGYLGIYNNDKVAFLRFDLSTVDTIDFNTISSAKLELTSLADETANWQIHEIVDQTWVEGNKDNQTAQNNEIIWDNAPAQGSLITTLAGSSVARFGKAEFDITQHIKNYQFGSGNKYVSFQLSTSANDYAGFASRERSRSGEPEDIVPKINFVIEKPVFAIANHTQSNVSCNGGLDGTASITAVSGGSGEYTYSWAPSGGTAATATGLKAGNYIVTVTDKNDQTLSAKQPFTITEPDTLKATASAQTNVSCNGGSDGSATVSATGGTPDYTYSWDTSPAQATATTTGLSAGTYTVTVTDANSCTAEQSVTITEPVALAATTSQTNVSCNGGNNGTATVTATGGTPDYTYSWGTSPAQTTATATGLSAGTYTVTVTDANSCTAEQSVTITEPVALAATTSQTDVSCNGGSDGSATVSATGGTPDYTYSWDTSPAQATATATGLSAGTYTVTVTDANSCTAEQSVTITEPAALAATVSQTDVSCNGGNNGTATVTATGGTGTYAYSWDTSPAQTTATATGLSAGTYTVTVTDANSCTAEQSVTITEPAALAATVSQTNVSCNGGNNGTATVTATGGTGTYAYSWDTSPAQTTATATGLSAGTYTVTVTDGNSCTAEQSVTITEPTVLAATTSQTDVSCHGGSDGSATVSATGGTGAYTYSWDTSPAQTTATATGLSTGTYTVTVTDANSCTAEQSVTITEPTVLAATTSQTNVICNGGNNGTATVTATGGTGTYAYSWDTSPAQTTATATGLSAGTYTVTVTDANNCTAEQSVTITEPVALAATTSQTYVSCYGGSDGSATVSATGGTGAYTYSWDTSPAQTTATATGLSSGTYTVTVTDGNSCTATELVTIGEPTALTATVSQTDVSCHGGSDGSATVSATGGTGAYTYSWGTSPVQATATATGLSSGTYTVTVTDGNSCTATESVTISQPPAPVFTLVGSAGPSTCGGMDGSIALSARNVADGTHMLQFSHDGQQQSRNLRVSGGNISLEGLGRGLYGQFRLAVGSCNYAMPVEEEELSDPVFTTSASNTGPYEAGEEIQLMAHNGVDFDWSGPNGFYSVDQSPSIPEAKESNAGTYRLVARGANGCTDTVSTVVAVNCLPSLGVTYYLAYSDGASPEVIAPLVQRLTVQANPARPMTVLAVPDCGTGGVESVRLQMSWWYAGQGYGLDRVDSEPLYTLHKLPYNPQGPVAGGYMGENFYTFTGTAYSADNGGGSKLLGPETVQFFIVGGERAISAPVASKWAFCNGGTFTVDVDSTGSFVGGNQFRVYLSDAAGSFASPRQVGFTKSPKGIACRIPFDVPSGSGYRLRVVSTAPVVASAVSERELSIIGKDLVLASPADDMLGGAADRRAVETVRASNDIGSGADVTYRAGKHIVLTPGFSVEAGSVFSTGISPQCPENE